ncbi:hypothetical protein ACJMK2_007107 [Sinanodonta woodiana]|uniref:Uncharacterized protein n=1 Tax=Sinanodonta woodiana TaxID=1069815 RepID=A0ABD3VHF8_SINWO
MWIIPLVLFWKHAVSLQNETIQRVISLGVIANGDLRAEDTNETFSFNRYSAIITWRHADMNEPFELFKAVQHFEIQPDIDAMLLLNYDNTNSVLEQITANMKKSVIRWKYTSPGNSLNVTTRCQWTLEEEELCKNEDNVSTSEADDSLCSVNRNVSAFVRTFNTYTVSVRTFNTYTVSVHTPQVLISLIITLEWTKVIIIYENFTEKETDEMMDALSANGILFIMYNIDMGALKERLQEAYRLSLITGDRIHFMVFCRLSCARRTLRQAAEHDANSKAKNTLLKEISTWFIATYGITTNASRGLTHCAQDLYNVAVFSFPEVQEKNYKDMKEAIMQMLSDLHKSGGNDNGNNLTLQAVDFLKTKSEAWNHPFNYTRFTIETLLFTQEMYRAFSPVGYVDIAGKVSIYSDIFPNIKYKFNKRKLTVSTLEQYPFIIKTTDPNGTITYEGLCIDLLNELADMLNFTYELVGPPDGKFGSKRSDGRWNGLVGQLERQEVDMVVAALSIQSERKQVMDFSYPFYYDHRTVLVKKIDPGKTKWMTLLKPMPWQVLVSIGAALIVSSFVFFLVEKYNPYYSHPGHTEAREVTRGHNSFAAAFWYMYGALITQGGVRIPDSIAGRMLIGFWGLFSVVVVGIYCGNLKAFLTVTINEPPPFNTIKELVQLKGEWKWGILGGTYLEFYIQNSAKKEFSDIGKGIKEFNKSDPSVLSINIDSHVEKVRSGGYAFISDKSIIESVIAKECSMMKIREEFLPLNYAIGLPKNSPYTNIVSDKILSMHEMGFMQCWKRRWWPKSSLCPERLMFARTIQAVDVQGCFYLAVIGIFFSSCVLVIELSVHFYQKRKVPCQELVINSG